MNDLDKPWEDPDFDDNPEWTEEDFAKAKPLSAVPELESALLRKPGRPRGSVKTDPKRQVSLRLDQDVLEHFRQGGPGWQSRINETLRKAMGLRTN